jgi:trk system potassium uptake protein
MAMLQGNDSGRRTAQTKVNRAEGVPWKLTLKGMRSTRQSLASPLTLVAGFALVILIGSIVLLLPLCTAPGRSTSFLDALFTATSAVCVTGLVVVDTGTHWSLFGQAVILGLIQVGGFGFMTSATLLLRLFGRRIGLRERLLVGETIGGATPGGLVRLIRNMALLTIAVEAAGALRNAALHLTP